MPTFSEIQDEIRNILDINADDLAPEQQANLEAYIEELGSMEAAKVDGFSSFLKGEESRAEACKQEAHRLNNKAKTIINRLGYLKSRYTATMQTMGITRINGNAYTISVRASEAVAVSEHAEIPELYLRTKITTEPDKTMLKEALKGGIEIKGVTLGKSYSLQIR